MYDEPIKESIYLKILTSSSSVSSSTKQKRKRSDVKDELCKKDLLSKIRLPAKTPLNCYAK